MNKLDANSWTNSLRKSDARYKMQVERSEIRMPDGPIHELGEFQIGVHLHSEVNAEVTVRVVAAE